MTEGLSSCPIWGDQADGIYIPQTNTFRVDDSSRAGGGYVVDRVVVTSNIQRMTNPEKARLTTWLVDQRAKGVPLPEITESVIDYTRAKRPLRVHERAESLLRYIALSAATVGDVVTVSQKDCRLASAWSESIDWPEVHYFLSYLTDKGWLKAGILAPYVFKGQITVDGYSQIADQQTNVDSSQAFVAMWFDESMTETYEDGIRPAIEEAGYAPLRIDRKEHINKIDDELIAEIRRSRFLVADFTHGADGARGGVYYEAGFAHGLELPVIFTCRDDALEGLHFDTNHYSHIVWAKPAALREKLKARILAVIGEGPSLGIAP